MFPEEYLRTSEHSIGYVGRRVYACALLLWFVAICLYTCIVLFFKNRLTRTSEVDPESVMNLIDNPWLQDPEIEKKGPIDIFEFTPEPVLVNIINE
ncbi:hypothetical protein B9Z55_027652 [Caenorhabditis nigoni]|uniref:Uncharacterized protein n=1 Tax=Caenorhabditis nigoni TaxID=1611254 RepID=A0A2G5SF07_9PELO|nr:hypothetical protein B9Z55_027652 [Caenorhabditis nigoni]